MSLFFLGYVIGAEVRVKRCRFAPKEFEGVIVRETFPGRRGDPFASARIDRRNGKIIFKAHELTARKTTAIA